MDKDFLFLLSIVVITGIIGLVVLSVVFFIATGKDGNILTAVASTIGALIGYFIKEVIKASRQKKRD